MPQTHPPDRFASLVTDVAERVPGATHAVATSADGLLLAASARIRKSQAAQLAAISASIVKLNHGAARSLDAGRVIRTVVAMEHGQLVIMPIRRGACLAVLATVGTDVTRLAAAAAALAGRGERARTGQVL